MAYEHFNVKMSELYEELDAVLHSLSYTHYMMVMDPSDKTIAEYEQMIDREKSVRQKIGNLNAEEMRQRSIDAGLTI